MVQNITGVLRVLSKDGGIKLDTSDAWINMAKGLKGFKQEDYEKFRNKKVVVTIENGYWIVIQEAAIEKGEKQPIANMARFGMLFNRTHEEALFQVSLKNQVDEVQFVHIFMKLQKLCVACEGVYHDS